jgi:hypothetical protein
VSSTCPGQVEACDDGAVNSCPGAGSTCTGCACACPGCCGNGRYDEGEQCDPAAPESTCSFPNGTCAADCRCVGEGGGGRPYRNIWIHDLSAEPPGLLVDAVELITATGSVFVSDVWESSVLRDRDGLIGPPGGCAVGEYAQLGGAGHDVTASFEGVAEIREGDTLVLHKCDGGVGGIAFELSVSVQASVGGPEGWTLVCPGGDGTVECEVPALPVVP